MPRSYVTPELPDGHKAVDLVAEDAKANELTPETIVTVVNRGRKPLSDMFDGRHYHVPAGYARMPYGAAVHFQKRAVVPGTRNLEQGGYVSWFGILGVDDPSMCEPFTDEYLESVGEKAEAIDRSAFSDPADRDVTVVKTNTARASQPGQGLIGGAGGSMRRAQHDTGGQATPAAEEAAAHIMDTPASNAAAEDTAAALADGYVPGADAGAPAPRPRRQR